MKDERPTHLDLFSGIGGFALAAKWAGFRTVAFCEIDKYCQRVLEKNFLADAQGLGNYEQASRCGRGMAPFADECSPRIFTDIFDFDGTRYKGCDLITGGFPCQPFSVAGKRRGAADDRHLWPEMLRVIKEARPAWVLGENVPGIIPMELDNVLSQLEALGYACRPFVIPACAVDARHRRNRLWIVAYSVGNESRRTIRGSDGEARCLSGVYRSQDSTAWRFGGTSHVADRDGNRLEAISDDDVLREQANNPRQPRHACAGSSKVNDAAKWLPEPDVGRVAHGIPSRVDRLRGLGNSIVPQVVYEILKEIRKLI